MKSARLPALFFILLLISEIALAEVIDFNIKPENPDRGDVVTVYGTASPNEEVKIEISFEKVVIVENGEYTFSVNGIKIPNARNKFTVTSYGCTDLDVSARRQIIGGLYTPWITLSKKAKNGIASISQSVPTGTYDVLIHGRSSQSSVRLKITATGYIKADESGRFSYSYDTSSIPPGNFVISAGGKTRVITLAESSSSSSGSSSGSSGSAVAPTATPKPTPAFTPALTPTPVATPASTETPVIPAITPTVVTPTPTAKTTATPENITAMHTPQTTGNFQQNETNRNQSSLPVPGFEFIIAMISLILVSAYRLR